MWRDPLEELIQALEKVVADVPVGNSNVADRNLSVEYVERAFVEFQLETDIILFGTPNHVAQLKPNGGE